MLGGDQDSIIIHRFLSVGGEVLRACFFFFEAVSLPGSVVREMNKN